MPKIFYNEESYLNQAKTLRKEIETFLSKIPTDPQIDNKVNEIAERSEITSIVLGYVFRSIKNKKKNYSLDETVKRLLIYREIAEFQKGHEMSNKERNRITEFVQKSRSEKSDIFAFDVV